MADLLIQLYDIRFIYRLTFCEVYNNDLELKIDLNF